MADKPRTICGRYTLDRKLGGDHDANVHLGTDVRTGERVAIKLESCRTRSSSLFYESKFYKHLQDGAFEPLGWHEVGLLLLAARAFLTFCSGPHLCAVGVAKLHWYGIEGDYSVVITDLLGPSLEDLFKLCRRQFSLKTVLMLADQLITRLEFLHERSFIHRDSTKPDNLVITAWLPVSRDIASTDLQAVHLVTGQGLFECCRGTGYQWDHVFDWYARRQQWSQYTQQQPEGVKEPQLPSQQEDAKEPQQPQQEDEVVKEPQQPQQEGVKEPQQPQQQQDEGAKQSQQPQQGQGVTATETEAAVEPGEAYTLDYGTYWLAAEDSVTAVPGGGGYLS